MKGTHKLIIGIILVFGLFGLFGCPSPESNPKEEKWDIRKQSVEGEVKNWLKKQLES